MMLEQGTPKRMSIGEIPRWEAPHRPPMGSVNNPAFLCMYEAPSVPMAGSLSSDEFDLDGPWHFHDMHQLMCAFEGAIEVEIENGRHLVPRQLAAWIPAGVPHRMSLHRVKSGSIFFPRDMISDAGDRVRAVLVSPLMREMAIQAMRWPLDGAQSSFRTSFFATMSGFCSEWIEQEVDLYLPTSPDERVQRALEYVADRLDEKLPDVCRHAGMSERSLRRHLKQATGMTLEAFRQRSRIVRAVSLLSETKQSIATVAMSCGFESPSAFARAFRGTMHETPRQYRIRLQNA